MGTAPRSAMLCAVLALVAAVSANAHHEVGGYDSEHPVLIHGVVREFIWANPHVMLYVAVRNAGAGQDEWTLEGESVPVLTRSGWTRTSLHAGEAVDVLLAPKEGGQRSGQILRVMAGDGRLLSIGLPSSAR